MRWLNTREKAIVNKIEKNQDYAKFKKFEAVLIEKRDRIRV